MRGIGAVRNETAPGSRSPPPRRAWPPPCGAAFFRFEKPWPIPCRSRHERWHHALRAATTKRAISVDRCPRAGAKSPPPDVIAEPAEIFQQDLLDGDGYLGALAAHRF